MKSDDKYRLWNELIEQLEAQTRVAKIQIESNKILVDAAKYQRNRYPKPKIEVKDAK